MKSKKPNANNIAVIDCETDPFKFNRIPKPFIWGFYDGVEFVSFNSASELLDYIADRKLTVYAHNGGKFDFHFLKDFIPEYTELKIINGRIAEFKIRNNRFRDSYLILPQPLSSFQKMEFDYAKMEPGIRKKYMTEIIEYLKKDCVYLYEWIDQFFKTYPKKLTLPGSALAMWKKISGHEVPRSSKFFHDTLKPFYFGGRCQAFRIGLINYDFKSADINSAYPYAMIHQHPISTVCRELTHNSNPKNLLGHNFYVVRAVAQGVFPYKLKTGQLVFPNDSELREYHVTGHELIAGIETGTVTELKIIKEYHFSDTINFKEYVDHFWNLKLNSPKSDPQYNFAKLFLNSLYGKFGTNPDKHKTYTLINPKYIQADMAMFQSNYYGEFGKHAIMEYDLPEDEKRYFNVATAASITGFTRAYLFKAINDIQKHGGTVLYCDTDSVAFVPGSKEPEYSDQLGAWEREGDFISGGIAGKKLYAFLDKNGKYKTASKGTKLEPEKILEIAANPDTEIEYNFEAPIFSVQKDPYFLTRKIRQTG